MILHTILKHLSSGETVPAGAHGQWFVATDVLRERSIEEMNIQQETGAFVLAFRRGFWSGNPHQEDAELFLWGTQEQLASAQEQFRLQPSVDALLDRPEVYWG